MLPSISIIIPTFNRPQKRTRAIRSCLQQSTIPSEILVIDNGENHTTKEAFEQLLPEATSTTLSYHKSEPFKIRKALSHGINKAQGNWIILLDDDDFLVEDRIRNDIEILKTVDSEVSILLHDFLRVDYTHSQIWEHTMHHKRLDLYEALTFDNFPPAAASTLRSSTLKSHHSYNLDGGNMDFDLFASLLPHGHLLKLAQIGYIMDDTRSKDRITTSPTQIIEMLALHRERFRQYRRLTTVTDVAIDTRIDQQAAFFSGKYEGVQGLFGPHSTLARQHLKEWTKGLISPLRALCSRHFSILMPEMRGSKSFSLNSYQNRSPRIHQYILQNKLEE
jgi:glycosyltransferase involved in cell wall biosynthesis